MLDSTKDLKGYGEIKLIWKFGLIFFTFSALFVHCEKWDVVNFVNLAHVISHKILSIRVFLVLTIFW